MTPSTAAIGAAPKEQPAVTPRVNIAANRKGLDLAILKKGAKDYLDFLDSTKDVFYAYLYHRTGSEESARKLLSDIYLDVLSRAMSLWWFGTLSLKLVLDTAERIMKDREMKDADLDRVYLPSLAWLTATEKKSVATLHDALWTLPKSGQQFVILSILIGLSDERIAEVMHVSLDQMRDQLRTAREFFVSRWQPTPDVLEKIQSLVFVPSLDLQAETRLRFSVVEKYNALRYRRYQWVIMGGLFAVMSNVIVAGVLAFAVIVTPPTSLKGLRGQIASIDESLLDRAANAGRVRESVALLSREVKRLDAYETTKEVTRLGLGAALETIEEQRKESVKLDTLTKALERARTALIETYRMIAALLRSI